MAETVDDPTLLRAAARDARAIRGQRMPWSDPLVPLVHAGIEAVRGHRDGAVHRLRAAIAGFEAADMALHAAASRRVLGKLLGGDDGRALVEGAEAWMRSETVKNPAKMTAMLAPGFAKLG
jgi:hypothetical protein